MINKSPSQLLHPPVNFFTYHPLSRSINASTINPNLKQSHPVDQDNQHNSRDQADWDAFLPTAKRLIESFGVFYNRSTDFRAALKWEELKSQGYRPVKRSKVNYRWWEEERKRGRVQPDHEQSYPLSNFHPQAKTPFLETERLSSAAILTPAQHHVATRVHLPVLSNDPLHVFFTKTRQMSLISLAITQPSHFPISTIPCTTLILTREPLYVGNWASRQAPKVLEVSDQEAS